MIEQMHVQHSYQWCIHKSVQMVFTLYCNVSDLAMD